MNLSFVRKFRGTHLLIAVSTLAVASFIVLSAVMYAHAATGAVVTSEVRNTSDVAISSAGIGSVVHDRAIVAASTSTDPLPLGTVDFNVYANLSCTGTPATQSGVALVSGVADSATTTVPSTGLSYKVHYNGQTDVYPPSDGACEPLSAAGLGTTLSTTLSTTSVSAGALVHDSATLSGATSDATGTVAYTVYSDAACSIVAQGPNGKTVTSGVIPDSDALLFNTAGTYYWRAFYSGDHSNIAASNACGSEILTVIATSTTPTPSPGTINGNVFNDQNKNDVKDGSEPGLSGWTVWLHTGAGYNGPITATALTDANGNYTFANLVFGTYFLEEQEQNGWNQTSSDTAVALDASHTSGTVNFANVQKGNATSTPPGKHMKCDGDNDADDVGCTATSTPISHHGDFGDFFKKFKNKFLNGHDNGKHLGELKHGDDRGENEGNGGEDD